MKPDIASVLKSKSSPLTASMGADPDADADVDTSTGADTDSDMPSPEEVSAVKLFESAKTPEQKAMALKQFIQACMPSAY